MMCRWRSTLPSVEAIPAINHLLSNSLFTIILRHQILLTIIHTLTPLATSGSPSMTWSCWPAVLFARMLPPWWGRSSCWTGYPSSGAGLPLRCTSPHSYRNWCKSTASSPAAHRPSLSNSAETLLPLAIYFLASTSSFSASLVHSEL